MKLAHFLDSKPLYYDKIDYDRFPTIYKKVENYFKFPKIIHLIGTNGKGTTGRFLATALLKKGFEVGHYTSPHILKFNERIWLNGNDIDDKSLELAHEKLLSLLTIEDADTLSYFEYTTLLAMIVFEKCDYVVLEAGLGGEYDATAVFQKELTLVTPIDFDHTTFLGNSIESIATTKLNAIQKSAIIGLQKYDAVYQIAHNITSKKFAELTFLKDQDELFWKKINSLSQELPNYLKENLALSSLALIKLGFEVSVDDFKDARLFGRLSQIASNVLLDVGHNPLAARAIVKALEGKKYTLIYNTYKDKDFAEILSILKPIIKTIEIIDVEEERIVRKDILEKTVKKLGFTCKAFQTVQVDENYLVFGSFSVAESFLKGWQS